MHKILQELSEFVGRKWAEAWLERLKARQLRSNSGSRESDKLRIREQRQVDSERNK